MNNKDLSRLYLTRIDLPTETRSQVVVILNNTLAATLDLKTQVKQAHWKGTPRFFKSLGFLH